MQRRLIAHFAFVLSFACVRGVRTEIDDEIQQRIQHASGRGGRKLVRRTQTAVGLRSLSGHRANAYERFDCRVRPALEPAAP